MEGRTDKQAKDFHWSLGALLALLSAFLTLLLIETALRLFYPAPYSIETNMYFEPDPLLGYKLQPNSIGSFGNEITARTNKYGHRDDDIELRKPAGVCRILVLGDSFTVGASVKQDEAYPQVLERMLNQHFAFPVEVVNTGVGGWSPFQYAQYYESYGRRFNPDLVVVGFFVGNDTYTQRVPPDQLPTAILGRRISSKAKSSWWVYAKVFLYNHSHIARHILYRGPAFDEDEARQSEPKPASKGSRRYLTEDYLDIQRSRLSNQLKRDRTRENDARYSLSQVRRIQSLAKSDAVPVIVVLTPDENQINADLQEAIIEPSASDRYDFEMPQSMLRELFGKSRIPYLDLLPYFRKSNWRLYMNDAHWTPDGHKLAASAIYKDVISSKLCSPVGPRSHRVTRKQ